jgi:hypothetical protein
MTGYTDSAILMLGCKNCVTVGLSGALSELPDTILFSGKSWKGGGMTTLDWIVVGAYFALILGLAWWVILQNKDTASDYFLAGRH